MNSIFAVDTRHDAVYAELSKLLQEQIYRDALQEDKVITKMKEHICLAVKKSGHIDIARYAQSLLDYIDIQYEGVRISARNTLVKLIEIK